MLTTWVDVAEPFHGFAGKFFKVAAEPTSPLSPFSSESKGAREASIDLFRRVVDGSDLKVPAPIRAELPELLWLLQMGVVLFWVHDSSDGPEAHPRAGAPGRAARRQAGQAEPAARHARASSATSSS